MRYDFRCLEPECGEVFEVEKRLTDTTPVACPTCESTNVKKVILSTPLFHVAWRNTLGLGHSGQIVLGSVEAASKPTKEKVPDEDEFPT